jgi:demethylmenaquinone methyltransferase/2-methoxy-6-polyprenyl-1,4-benzoquinol methylase
MMNEDLEDRAGSRADSPLPPHPTLSRYYEQDAERPAYIRGLFDASARHYDRISSLMSFGTDKSYRRRVLLEAGLAPGMSMLDVACGTGMVSGPATEIVGPTGRVVGLDPSPGMLGEAVRHGRVKWAVQGVAERLPLADDSFDLLCMGFALRHVSDLLAAFGEYKRVLKPGGTVLILEITAPRSRVSYHLFKFYLETLLPKITRVSTFNPDAQLLMSYFWDTVEQCVPPETVLGALREAGFERITRRVKIGVFSEYKASKP